MDDKAFWQKLREIIREEITIAMQTYLTPVNLPEEEIMLGTADLCRQLKLSRQTLYNWLKHLKTRPLLAANRQKTGNKVLYNTTGIKAAIKKQPALFGSGRAYAFKDEAVLSDAQKADRRFIKISTGLVLNTGVSGDGQEWYQTEKLRRENEQGAAIKYYPPGG